MRFLLLVGLLFSGYAYGYQDAIPTNTGAGATVGVIDSGFDLSNDCFVNRTAQTIIRDFTDGQADKAAYHGTGVASLIGGNLPIRGVVPDANLVLCDAGGRTFDWALVGQALRYLIDRGDIDVINISIGGTAPDGRLSILLDEAYAKGIVVVAASGNYHFAIDFPARHPRVIAASALDASGQPAQFVSTKDDSKSIYTIGEFESIATVSSDPKLGPSDAVRNRGTSFSAPIVSGIAALYALDAKRVGLVGAERVEWVRNALRENALLVGAYPVARYAGPARAEYACNTKKVSWQGARFKALALGIDAGMQYPVLFACDHYWGVIDSPNQRTDTLRVRIKRGRMKLQVSGLNRAINYAISGELSSVRLFSVQ